MVETEHTAPAPSREPSSPPDEARAARYHRAWLALSAGRLTLTLVYLGVVVGSGVARPIAALVGPWPARVALVGALLAAGGELLGAPLMWMRGFWLPRRYGLLHQPFAAWLVDRLKGAAIGAVVGLAALEAVYALLRSTPLWWLGAAGVFLVFHVVAAAVLPVWILPLFYAATPLGDDSLRARLLALAHRAGVDALGVWVVDQSRKSRTANAAVVGLGRTRRILLFDTLTANFTPDEIESVLAHELGHHVHADLRRGLVVQGALTGVMFFAIDAALRAAVPWLELRGVADPAGIPWLVLLGLLGGLVSAPLANTFSRRIERQADDFALATTGNARAFVGAMERLANLNLARRRPPRLEEIVLYSHPSVDRRISRARATLPA